MKKQRTSVAWSEREDALICRLRNKNCDLDDIAEKLPHRTRIAVKRRCAHLIAIGRIASHRAAWSTEEDELLCTLRAKDISPTQMVEHFTDRTRDAIAQRLQQLRLQGRIDGGAVEPKPHRPWTHREESLVLRLRDGGSTLQEIAAELPHRTRRAVALRVQELIAADELERSTYSPLSQRPWSSEEDELVTVMRRADKSASEIAATLDRTVASVRSRIAQRIRKGETFLLRDPPQRAARNGKPERATP